jgi:hypothetical protein
MADHAKGHVEKTIPDEERRKAALHALSRVDEDIGRLNGGIEKDLGKFQELVRDYGTKPEDFDRLFEASSDENLRLVEAVWQGRTELLAHVRPDEWTAIVAEARADQAKQAAKTPKEKAE